MNNVYVYLHWRAIDSTCFYVGMGRGNRAHDFHNRSIWWNHIKEKYGVRVEIIYERLSFEHAVEIERAYIAHFRESSLGALVNCTSGGEGMSGIKNYSETRRRKSESAKKLNADPAFREKKLKQLQATRDEDGNKKRSESHKKRLLDPEARRKHLETFNRNRCDPHSYAHLLKTPEVQKKKGASIRKYLMSPENRHIGIMKAALMNAARWKRPFTNLGASYFNRGT